MTDFALALMASLERFSRHSLNVFKLRIGQTLSNLLATPLFAASAAAVVTVAKPSPSQIRDSDAYLLLSQ